MRQIMEENINKSIESYLEAIIKSLKIMRELNSDKKPVSVY